MSWYERIVPADAFITPNYQGTPEQTEALRMALRQLTRGDGSGKGPTVSLPAILREAGLNVEGGMSYDQSGLARFIDGTTESPRPPIAKALYQRWINRENTKLNLAAVDNVFYHAALIAMDINGHAQVELSRILSGYYFFYKRSSLNPDFFVKGLMTITLSHDALHVTEIQYHRGGGGIPETEEVEKGFALMKGNIIYIITRSERLKGATFRVIYNHPVRSDLTNSAGTEKISTLYGYQISGREYTAPASSPFVATRIPAKQALEAQKGRGSEMTEDSDNYLGFCEALPKYLERHLRSAV